ncbi:MULTISPECIES: GntR family transcriptional regulator [unclassified Leucobacter]|uniref:GntR family transcriptional regulator n=1 Tax=unclassified Leucobacter TaxID=2621730 RepID=UPI00165D352D|nr:MULTISPECIES: GntR family transcriptional regulator [unclassified Leucobacter]MBC9926524.1 GntR family transcriptional regulator [Leucobacter sp. cx-169]
MNSPAQIAQALRTRILALEIAPGSPLREVAVAEAFGCSRRTAREALMTLGHEGIVRHERNRGASVRSFTRLDVQDLYRVRRTLEAQGARACRTAPQELLDNVRDAYARLEAAARTGQDSPAHAFADVEFHASVIALLGSPRIDAFFANLSVEMVYAIRLLHRDEVESAVGVSEALADHRSIADAIVARNSTLARREVLAHVAENEARLIRLSTVASPR